MFQHTWHGIELASLPAAAAARHAPASAEFYAQFYAALESGRGRVEPGWLEDKRRLGEVIGREILGLGPPLHGAPPRVLALAAGKAFAERVWLECGADVTFHDCQEASLADLRRQHPPARCLIGEIHRITPETDYDFITLLTVDYVMRRRELAEFLRRISGWLAAGGQIVLYCANVLSLRQMLAETVKMCLGRRRDPRAVFWGYWRTPGEFFRVARRAGLRLAQVLYFAGERGGGRRLRPASRWVRRWPPLRDSNLVATFTPAH